MLEHPRAPKLVEDVPRTFGRNHQVTSSLLSGGHPICRGRPPQERATPKEGPAASDMAATPQMMSRSNAKEQSAHKNADQLAGCWCVGGIMGAADGVCAVAVGPGCVTPSPATADKFTFRHLPIGCCIGGASEAVGCLPFVWPCTQLFTRTEPISDGWVYDTWTAQPTPDSGQCRKTFEASMNWWDGTNGVVRVGRCYRCQGYELGGRRGGAKCFCPIACLCRLIPTSAPSQRGIG